MDKHLALRVAGIVFSVVALAHLLRILYHVVIVIAGYTIPMWLSYVALIVAFALAVLMFKAAGK